MKNLFNLHPKKIENDLKNIDLKFSGYGSAEFLNIPPMLEIFWELLYHNAEEAWDRNEEIRIVPSQKEFLDGYLTQHEEKLDQLPENKFDGVKGRLRKTYPSLVREFHCLSSINYLSIKHDFPCTLQISNSWLDMSKGVDLAIQMNGVSFSIQITKTDSAIDWGKIKAKRKEDVSTPHRIVIVANEKNRYSVGTGKQFYLIKPEVVKRVLSNCYKVSKGEVDSG